MRIKAAIAIAVTGFAQLALAQNVKRYYLVSGSDTEIIFIDKLSIRKTGDSVQFWTLIVYRDRTRVADGKFADYGKVQWRANCRERISGANYFTMYTYPGGLPVFSGGNNIRPMKPVSPDSIGEEMLLSACVSSIENAERLDLEEAIKHGRSALK